MGPERPSVVSGRARRPARPRVTVLQVQPGPFPGVRQANRPPDPSLRVAVFLASISRGDHVATLLTEARVLRPETSTDSDVIRYVLAAKAEHVLHTSLSLLGGRGLIASVYLLRDYSCHCDSKSDGAAGFEERSQTGPLVLSHVIPSVGGSAVFAFLREAQHGLSIGPQTRVLVGAMPASSRFADLTTHGAGHLCRHDRISLP
ncbi:hypothetical protein ACVWW1_008970 [Bradyrhizobium sp. JR3.5]